MVRQVRIESICESKSGGRMKVVKATWTDPAMPPITCQLDINHVEIPAVEIAVELFILIPTYSITCRESRTIGINHQLAGEWRFPEGSNTISILYPSICTGRGNIILNKFWQLTGVGSQECLHESNIRPTGPTDMSLGF